MVKREEDRIVNCRMIILLLLYFFLVVAYIQNSHDRNVAATFQYQTATFYSFTISAKDNPQLFSLLGFVSPLHEICNNHFNEQLRLLSANRLINLKIILSRKVELLIKPVILQSLSCYYLPRYSDPLPVLSLNPA